MGIDLTLPSDSSLITPEDLKRLGVNLALLFSDLLARNSRESENSSLFGETKVLDKVRVSLPTVLPRILKPTIKSWCVQLPSTGTSGLVPSGYYLNFASRTELHQMHACSPTKRTSRSTERCTSPKDSLIPRQDENKQVVRSA